MIHIKRQTELKAPLLYDTRNTLSNEPNSKVILLLLLSFYRNRPPQKRSWKFGNRVVPAIQPSSHSTNLRPHYTGSLNKQQQTIFVRHWFMQLH